MDTRLETRQYRLNKWADIIHDRCESGMNVSEYCHMHDISKNAYYYWLKKLKENVLETSGITFAEITPCSNDAENDRRLKGISVNIGGAVINIPEGSSKELLSMVVEVLNDVERSQ